MLVFFSIFILVAIIDVKDLISLKMNKELIIYFIFMLVTILLAIYYYSDTFRDSFIHVVLEMLNVF